ncbi:MAG: FKBP-type peptidyl-prolyl cis-trans isomerase [Mediterranea sp.]|nr:FKBP-type peptidyl-prolyl cis-trans isomerase [Mediterranea sp.]
MKQLFSWVAVALLSLSALFTACDEVTEPTIYDNWQERNEAFIDSISALTGNVTVATIEQADKMPIGQLFSIYVPAASTNEETCYIYCKKLRAVPEGRRPLYTEQVSTFYYGTLITGNRFDGNFTGFPATYQGIINPEEYKPQATDSPTEFGVSQVISGWTAALQLMRTGERWMLYIPHTCAYGTTGSGSIPGYSALTFDVELVAITLE